MAIGKDGAVGRRLRMLFNVGAIGELSDGQLLERFATGRGEGSELAFAALVERHGSMVLRVCRGVLDDPHDSQDAFQATFLVLVAKGRALWVRDSLGPWLHQVAYRTASCARSNAARRRRLERLAAKEEQGGQPEMSDDLGRILHEEIHRLPERYRAPVVLCDLEGRTHEQAARHLGWPVGTVKSRQARARERLRVRLVRRGFAPGVGLLGVSPGLTASLPVALVDSTTAAAVRFFATRAIAPGSAALLAQGVIRTMAMTRWLKVATVLAALGAAGSGAGRIAQERGEKPGEAPRPEEARQAAPAADKSVVEVKPGKFNFTLSERGSLESASSRDVLCEVEGSTTIIMIKPEGTRVKEREIVAELDSATLRDTLLNQKITIQQAEASHKQARLVREVAEYAVKEYLEGILPQERETMKGKIIDAESGIQKDEARLERARNARRRFDEALGPNKAPTTPSDIAADLTIEAQLDDATSDLARQKRALELAKSELEVLEKFTREKMTRQLSSDVEQAKSNELRKQYGLSLEQTKEKKLERQIEKCILRAPVDGVLVYANDPSRARIPQTRIQIEEGATVRERQKIFSVFGPADPMRVNTKVHESMVDQVFPGMAVRIKVDAVPNELLTGTVMRVAPMADANNIFADGKKVYTTFISIDQKKNDLNLRPGMTAAVEIVIAELDNVLTVPAGSVFNINGKERVICKTADGGVEWRDVTFGLSNGKSVEVKKGLRPGDLVISDTKSQLTREMRDKLIRECPQLEGHL